MIYLILGENAYRAEQELRRVVDDGGLNPERIDASNLTPNTLADIVRGGSLFSEQRLIVLRQLSDNKSLFEKLGEWAGELTQDTTLVLLETKLDKRTKAYKTLTKQAKVILANPLAERDHREAEEWLAALAQKAKVKVSQKQIADMVRRGYAEGDKPGTRHIDQMLLARAVGTLAGQGEIADEMIETILPPAVDDTVFDLLEMAVHRERDKVGALLTSLEHSEDPHRTLALLLSQWAQIASVALADGPLASVAVELGIHPYAAKKMQSMAREFTRQDLRSLTDLAARLDAGAKLSQFAPWDAVFRFLHAVVNR